MDVKGKIIWITGASAGIGASLTKKLAAQGAWLILTARNGALLESLQSACATGTCKLLPADLSNFNPQELTATAIALFGHIDMIIHCAGVSQRSLAIETGMDVYRSLMEINFFAPVAITRYLLPHFNTRPESYIVAVGSMAGLMGFPKRTGYAAAKHALKGFFETLQVEHTIAGLHITLVQPGRINTRISLSALTANGAPHGIMDQGQLNGIPVEKCTDKILRAITANKKVVIIAKGERVLWWLWWYLPAAFYKIARKTGLARQS